MCVTLSFNDANIACYQAEMFPQSALHRRRAGVEHRLRGVRRHVASMVATALIDATGNGLMPAYYMMGICLVAGIILLVHGARVRRQGIERHRVEDRRIEKEEGSGKGRVERPFPLLRRVGALARLHVAIPCATAGAAPGAPRFGVVSCGHGFSENICGGDGAHRRRRTAHAARDRLARRPHLRHRPRARGHSTRFQRVGGTGIRYLVSVNGRRVPVRRARVGS